MIIIYPWVYKVVLRAGADIYNKVNSRRNQVSKHDLSKSVCPKITNGRHLVEKNTIEYGDVYLGCRLKYARKFDKIPAL